MDRAGVPSDQQVASGLRLHHLEYLAFTNLTLADLVFQSRRALLQDMEDWLAGVLVPGGNGMIHVLLLAAHAGADLEPGQRYSRKMKKQENCMNRRRSVVCALRVGRSTNQKYESLSARPACVLPGGRCINEG